MTSVEKLARLIDRRMRRLNAIDHAALARVQAIKAYSNGVEVFVKPLPPFVSPLPEDAGYGQNDYYVYGTNGTWVCSKANLTFGFDAEPFGFLGELK